MILWGLPARLLGAIPNLDQLRAAVAGHPRVVGWPVRAFWVSAASVLVLVPLTVDVPLWGRWILSTFGSVAYLADHKRWVQDRINHTLLDLTLLLLVLTRCMMGPFLGALLLVSLICFCTIVYVFLSLFHITREEWAQAQERGARFLRELARAAREAADNADNMALHRPDAAAAAAASSASAPQHWPPALAVPEELASAGVEAVPRAFLCPLSMEIMRQPAITPRGTTYDYSVLARWLATSARYPSAEAQGRLTVADLVPNRTLHGQIEDWLAAQHQVAGDVPSPPPPRAAPRRPARSPARARGGR